MGGGGLPGVEAKSTGGCEGSQDSGQRDGQDGCPEVCNFGVSADSEAWEETLVLLVATAQDMPTSRWLRGKTSAEYVKGTGPSPGE